MENRGVKRQRTSYEDERPPWCSAKSAGNAVWKKQKKINILNIEIDRKIHNEICELQILEHEKDILFNIKKQAISGDPKYIEAIHILISNGYEQEKDKLNKLNEEKEYAQRTKISYDRDKNNLQRDLKNKKLDQELSLLTSTITNTQRMNV